MKQQKELVSALYSEAFDANENGDSKRAFSLFMQGAVLGDDAAQHAVGIAYDSGLGVEEDKEEAILWFKKAWKTGKQTFYCVSIALTYTEINQHQRAMYWWRKAIALGDGSAALALAKSLIEKNKPQASNRILYLLKRAVESQESWQITLNEKEEAEKLLKKLMHKSLNTATTPATYAHSSIKQ